MKFVRGMLCFSYDKVNLYDNVRQQFTSKERDVETGLQFARFPLRGHRRKDAIPRLFIEC